MRFTKKKLKKFIRPFQLCRLKKKKQLSVPFVKKTQAKLLKKKLTKKKQAKH